MLFVFRGTETRRRRVLLAHVRTPFCLPIVLASGEVIDARSQVDPHDGIGRAARFCQGFGRKLVGSRVGVVTAAGAGLAGEGVADGAVAFLTASITLGSAFAIAFSAK